MLWLYKIELYLAVDVCSYERFQSIVILTPNKTINFIRYKYTDTISELKLFW